jgi:ABC-type lipoprotein export system ATPase subunit
MTQAVQSPTAAQRRTDQPILSAHGVRKVFRMGDSTVEVLKHVDISLQPGEFVAIEGRSGSGKSTLLHILGALEAADAGTVTFDGREYTRRVVSYDSPLLDAVTHKWVARGLWWALVLVLAAWALSVLRFVPGKLVGLVTVAWALLFLAHWGTRLVLGLVSLPDDWAAARLRNEQFGFVFQFYHLLPELNVLENTLLAPMIENSWLGFRSKKKQLRQRGTELLTSLGLGHRLKHRPSQLSGGERQRVAIARALMNSPRVLFADEPTGNLDAETGKQIMALLEKLHQESGQTIVMVTHDRSLARQADRVLILKDGKLEKPAA